MARHYRETLGRGPISFERIRVELEYLPDVVGTDGPDLLHELFGSLTVARGQHLAAYVLKHHRSALQIHQQHRLQLLLGSLGGDGATTRAARASRSNEFHHKSQR